MECPVGSISDFNYCKKFNELVLDFGGGKALFTEPNTPIRCTGSAQNITFLTEDRLKNKGVRNSSTVEFRNAVETIF